MQPVGILSWTDDVGSHRVEVTGPAIVGSSPRADVRIQHAGIARWQAEVTAESRGVRVRDLESGRASAYAHGTIIDMTLSTEADVRFGAVPVHIVFEPREIRRVLRPDQALWSDAWNDALDRAWECGQRSEPMLIRGRQGAMFDYFADRVHGVNAAIAGYHVPDRPLLSVDCWRKDSDESLGHMLASRAGVEEWKPGMLPDPTLDLSTVSTLHVRHAQ